MVPIYLILLISIIIGMSMLKVYWGQEEFIILSFILFGLIMLVIVRFIHFDNHLALVNRLEEEQLARDEKSLLIIPVEAEK
jgi:hypothetical protein